MITEARFLDLTKQVIQNLEGGYYHPDMLTDGRMKYDARYLTSGETMMGIDRKNGGTINTLPEGKKFWALIDASGARKSWKWNYRGGALEPVLTIQAAKVMKPQFDDNARRYLSEDARKAVAQDPGLLFHFIYASWNGPGWFQKFAIDINKAVAAGKTGRALWEVALNSRLKEGLKPGSPPNSLIAQGGRKILAMLQVMGAGGAPGPADPPAPPAPDPGAGTSQDPKTGKKLSPLVVGLLALAIFAVVRG